MASCADSVPVALLADDSSQRSRRVVLLVSLGLEAFMFLTTFVVLVCVRQLYSQETGYNPYDWTDRYSIRPEYFDPPLPAPSQNTTSSILPMDDVLRYYHSPLHYNPLNCTSSLRVNGPCAASACVLLVIHPQLSITTDH